MAAKQTEPRPSDDIVAEVQELQRQEDAIRERKRELRADLELALIGEGKALSPLAAADLRDREARAALRAQLDALDAQEG